MKKRIMRAFSPHALLLEQICSQRLSSRGVPEDRVDTRIMPVPRIWVRDFGPLVVKSFDGEVAVLDNTTVLHASYYAHPDLRGYPISVRYLA